MSSVGLLCTAAVLASAVGLDFGPVEEVLLREVQNHTFPGAVALVATARHPQPIFVRAVGRHTFDAGSAPVRSSTPYDLASLTKVLSTTTATMVLYQRGLLDLDARVSDPTLLGAAFAAAGKGAITVKNLLLHNSGFPPDPTPNFWDPAFGCEQAANATPPSGRRLTFDCLPRVYAGLMRQGLENPVGAKFVYSDISMITMMFVVGHVARRHQLVPASALRAECVRARRGGGGRGAEAEAEGEADAWQAECYYEAFVRTHVFEALGMSSSGFLPSAPLRAAAAPACVGTGFRACPMQGVVSDDNAFATGGVSGHAGLFSTAPDVHRLLRRILFADADDAWINSTTVAHFTAVHNTTQSSRGLGWDTNDYGANTYRGCGNLSATTFTHTGYTGTQVCCDPARGLITVLLTNRCFPDDSPASKSAVHRARQRFNNAVMGVVG